MSLSANVLAAFLAVPFGLSLGSALRANSSVSVSVEHTNAYYDLACLYGDTSGDGVLSDSEFLAFKADSLMTASPDSDFRFLGFLPYGSSMYFYVYSSTPFDSYDSSTDSQKSLGYYFQFSYRNSMEVSSDGTSYLNDEEKTVSPSFLNSYHGKKGFFCKFSIPDYSFRPDSDGKMRIQAESFMGLDHQGNVFLKQDGLSDNVLFFDSSYSTTGAACVFYSKSCYSVSGELDGYLATGEQKSGPDHSVLWFPVGDHSDVTSAHEMAYFFFSFDDPAFSVDEITSVRFSYHLVSFHQTHWTYVMKYDVGTTDGSLDKGIYTGTSRGTFLRNGSDGSPVYLCDDDPGFVFTDPNTFITSTYQNTISHVIRSDQINQVVNSGNTSFVQTDVRDGFRPILRKHSYSNIVKVDKEYLDAYCVDMETDSSGKQYDAFAPFRSYMESDNHLSYQWAYLVDLGTVREASYTSFKTEKYYIVPFAQRPNYGYEIGSTDSSCHEADQLTTLTMDVVKDNKAFSIRVINDPATTRKNFSVGFEAPTLLDFVVSDIRLGFADFWSDVQKFLGNLIPGLPWWGTLIIFLLIVTVILALIFKPFCKVVKFVFELVVEVLYLDLIWWWVSLIRKICKKDPLPVMLFRK